MSEPHANQDTNATAETSEERDAAKASSAPREAESPKSSPPEEPPVTLDPMSEARAEATRMKEQWIRTAADFDNFRKRTRRELEDNRKAGKEELLKDFLPVFDNLERAIQSAQRAQDVKAVADGLNMILRQFTDTLGRAGISKVPTVGKEFDPTVHEAIQQVESEDHTPGTVVAEVQPGYAQGDRLVRAAMVVVAKAKEKATAETDGDASAGPSTASE